MLDLFSITFESIVSPGDCSASLHLTSDPRRTSRRYNFILGILNCPPVALSAPEKRLNISCSDLTV